MPSLPTLLLLVYSKGNPTILFYIRLFTYHKGETDLIYHCYSLEWNTFN